MKILVNGYLMCLVNVDSMDHLMLRCQIAQFLWNSMLSWFNCNWVLPYDLHHLLEAWSMLAVSSGGKVMWWLSILAILWILWKERNRCCFEVSPSLPMSFGINCSFMLRPGPQLYSSFKIFPSRPSRNDVMSQLYRHSPDGFLPLRVFLNLTLMGAQFTTQVVRASKEFRDSWEWLWYCFQSNWDFLS